MWGTAAVFVLCVRPSWHAGIALLGAVALNIGSRLLVRLVDRSRLKALEENVTKALKDSEETKKSLGILAAGGTVKRPGATGY
jgi:hypothetical protein